MRALLIRLAQVAVVVGLYLSLSACGCPAPTGVEQTFQLNATQGTPLSIDVAGADAAADAAADARRVDAAVPVQTPPIDCTSLASGCVPGGSCLPACNCVLARVEVQRLGAVTNCTLVAGSGPAAVDVHYEVDNGGGCGD